MDLIYLYCELVLDALYLPRHQLLREIKASVANRQILPHALELVDGIFVIVLVLPLLLQKQERLLEDLQWSNVSG